VSDSVADALRRTAERLEAAGCESPRLDAELLVAHVLGMSRAGLYGESRLALSDEERAERGCREGDAQAGDGVANLHAVSPAGTDGPRLKADRVIICV